MRPILSQSSRLALAVQVLTRYVERTGADAEAVIEGSRALIADALRAGNLPIARHVVNSFAAAVREYREGIEEQLRPLIDELGPCITLDAELAGTVLPIARQLGLVDLHAACLARLREVIGTIPSRRKAG